MLGYSDSTSKVKSSMLAGRRVVKDLLGPELGKANLQYVA